MLQPSCNSKRAEEEVEEEEEEDPEQTVPDPGPAQVNRRELARVLGVLVRAAQRWKLRGLWVQGAQLATTTKDVRQRTGQQREQRVRAAGWAVGWPAAPHA